MAITLKGDNMEENIIIEAVTNTIELANRIKKEHDNMGMPFILQIVDGDSTFIFKVGEKTKTFFNSHTALSFANGILFGVRARYE